MRLAKRHQGEHGVDVDLTPMIDVVFLLIIFFMTTAQFARMTRAEVQLPPEPGEEATEEQAPGLVINVTASGEIIVDNSAVPLDLLFRMVAAEVARAGADASKVELWIRADRAAPAAAINRIASGLTELGVRSWRLATEVPPPRSGEAP